MAANKDEEDMMAFFSALAGGRRAAGRGAAGAPRAIRACLPQGERAVLAREGWWRPLPLRTRQKPNLFGRFSFLAPDRRSAGQSAGQACI